MVMQAADNSYYLRRDEKGAYSIWGCYFADYEADLTASGPSRNTVIYGHSSLDDETEGKKFTELKKLNLFDFADEHRCFYFSTRDASYVAEIFSVGYWPDSAQYLYADPTDAAFEDLLEEAKATASTIIRWIPAWTTTSSPCPPVRATTRSDLW